MPAIHWVPLSSSILYVTNHSFGLTAHAGRNLPVKEFCYLRTVTWQPPCEVLQKRVIERKTNYRLSFSYTFGSSLSSSPGRLLFTFSDKTPNGPRFSSLGGSSKKLRLVTLEKKSLWKENILLLIRLFMSLLWMSLSLFLEMYERKTLWLFDALFSRWICIS